MSSSFGAEKRRLGSFLENKTPFQVKLDWTGKMQFVASDDRNHSLVVDTSSESGGDDSGPSPGRLLLIAVAGCTAIDVVDILLKSRQKLTGLQVQSRSIQNSEYPKYHKEIQLKYILKGIDLDKSRVERAIKLSKEKYCSVGATVSGKAKIIIQYEIQQEEK